MAVLTLTDAGRQLNGQWLLRGINLSLPPGGKLAVHGATGSGKTTLLKLAAGLLPLSTGEVLFRGQRVKGPDERLLPGEPGIAYLSQHFELRNHYRVAELLAMANRGGEAEALTIAALCRVDHLLSRWTHEISGGERQRIALASLLVGQPAVLLLDEPFSNLDPFHKTTLRQVVDDVNANLGTACLLVSHDPQDSLPWADEILLLRNGEAVQQGPPKELYRYPVDGYAAGLLGPYNQVSTEVYQTLGGEPRTTESVIVRPEDLMLTKSGEGVAATVQRVQFFGATAEVTVKAGEEELLVSAAGNSDYAWGEQVWLRLSTDSIIRR